MTATTRPHAHDLPSLRDAQAVAELFIGVFRRDLLAFFPQSRFETAVPDAPVHLRLGGPDFRLIEAADGEGRRGRAVRRPVRLGPRGGGRFSPHDRRMIRAIGAVLSLRYHHLFQVAHAVAAGTVPGRARKTTTSRPSSNRRPMPRRPTRPSRIASTILTLRTAALSTYENRRVSTGALLLGPGDDPDHPPGRPRPTPCPTASS